MTNGERLVTNKAELESANLTVYSLVNLDRKTGRYPDELPGHKLEVGSYN